MGRYIGTKEDLEYGVRWAMGKRLRVRRKIAKGLGISVVTLDRKIVAFRKMGGRGLNRKGRSDRGRPRALPPLWINIARTSFFSGQVTSYAALHREIVKRCDKKGIKPPSGSWVRRWINEAFRRLLSNSRIQRLGDFQRRRRSAP